MALADEGGAAGFERRFGAGLLEPRRRAGGEARGRDDPGAIDRNRHFAQLRWAGAVRGADGALEADVDRSRVLAGQGVRPQLTFKVHAQAALLDQLSMRCDGAGQGDQGENG